MAGPIVTKSWHSRMCGVVGILVASCGLVSSLAAQTPIVFATHGLEAELPARFRLSDHVFASREVVPTKASWLPGLQPLEVYFPSPVVTEHRCNNEVACEYFAPLGTGRHPGVVVLHILGGDFELSRLCCRSLAVQGVGALFVKLPYYGPRRPMADRVRLISPDPAQTVAGMTQAVLDIRRAAAWLAARNEIDPENLGITGISLGGVTSALAASMEPRFRHVCLVLAGGDLQRVILESDETADVRAYWAERTFDPQEVKNLLAQIDPLTHAHRLQGRHVVMFNAKHDRTVPVDCTKALWQAMGQPEIHWWNADHYSAIRYLPSALVQMGQFFRQPAVTAETPPRNGGGD